MCGRYLLDVDFQSVIERYQITATGVIFKRMPEVFPSDTVPVILTRVGHREAVPMRWGFPSPYGKNLIINARGETVADKPLFKDAFARRRCLIPASAFYEWRKADGRSTRWRIERADGGLLSLAGLYGLFPGAEPIFACTIITTAANALLAPIHDRMPVLIPPEAESLWLAPDADRSGLAALLTDPGPAALTAVAA